MNRRKFLQTVALGGVSLMAMDSPLSRAYQNSEQKKRGSDFNDERSKKVIFVAHCVLNQNARIRRYAYWPTGMTPVTQFLENHRIGVVQMPCPELIFLGLDRKGQIYKQLSDQRVRKGLREMAKDICYQISQYREHGFRVLGVIGIDGSPCCGVTKTWDGYERPGTGKFISELKGELEKQKINIVVKGFEDKKMSEALSFLTALV